MSIAVAAPERSLHENNTAPNSLAGPVTKRNNGFLSTLASYLTSTHKSDPKPVVQRRKLMNSWDDVDLVKLNMLVCNVLYEANSYEPLISEIERVVGKRREHCLYGAASVLLTLVLLHDAIGALTVFMTLMVPTFFTISAVSFDDSNEQNQLILKETHDFFVKYWTVYAVFVVNESFVSSLIQWDLRLLRLIFMSTCLSSRVPILDAVHAKIIGVVSKVREVIEKNNYEQQNAVPQKKLN